MEQLKKYFSESFFHSRIVGIDQKSVDAIVSMEPNRVEIQPTTRCNRHCSFCSHSERNKSGRELSQTEVEQVINDLVKMSCRHVSFSGGGEPFSWTSGQLATAIAYANQYMDVTLTTNGDGFWDEKNDCPVNLGIMKNCSSLIINTPEVDDTRFREMVYGNCNWSKTRKVLTSLIAFKEKERCECSICCVVVVNKKNILTLSEIDRCLSELGVTRIYYKSLKHFEENNLEELATDDLSIYQLRQRLLETQDNISVWLRDYLNNLDVTNASLSKHCWANMLGLSAIVDPNGDVFLCTPYVGRKDYALGNIHQTSIKDLWNSDDRYKLILRMHQEYAYGQCPQECRFRTYNELIEGFILEEQISNKLTVNAGIDNYIG